MRQTGAVLAALVLASGIASARERPNLLPMRDVDVTYRISRPEEPRLRERVRWKAADALERVDIPGGAISIFDHRMHYVTVLTPATHSYLKLPSRARGPVEPARDAPLARGGETTIAGLGCTIWNWANPEDQAPYSACVTEDGLPLRLRQSGQTVAEAVTVRYGKQDPKLFEVPSGYEPSVASEGGMP